MKICLFGANGPVGRLTTDRALAAGHEVTAVTRRPESYPGRERPGLTVVQGDVREAADVRRAVEGQDAVITMVGVPYTFKPIDTYSVGIRHILQAMSTIGIRRIVAVTSIGANPDTVWSEGMFWNILLKPFIGSTLYKDMRAMETELIGSDVDWTLARPAQLVDTDEVTDYIVAEGFLGQGHTKTSRLDLADFVLRQLDDPHGIGKGYAVTSPV